MLSRSCAAALLAAGLGCSPGSPLPGGGARLPAVERATQPTESGSARPPLARFVSVNIPNLHYIEDDWRFDSTMRYRLPTEFEIRDALEAVRQMGGRVVRIYALSVRKPTDVKSVPRHVNGPGEFNEAAFRALDLVLAVAREYGIQVIIPFVDNWQWWGGVAEYAAFRGLERDAFWSDEQVFADFRRTLEFVATRKNSVNGVVYRDDPTIYAWETGNELEAPWTWTERTAHALRQWDDQHPIVDGVHSRFVRDEALRSPLIDVLTTHHYTDGGQLVADVRANVRAIAGRKPYFVGEFGFISPHAVEDVLDAVIEEPMLGALIWSLRFRNRDGGFYTHGEKPGFESYHWPGFAAGEHYDEATILSILRDRAHRISGTKAQSTGVPRAPTLLEHSQPGALFWQGSAGATSYAVERRDSTAGVWRAIASDVSDAEFAYRPQYVDNAVPLGTDVYYRVSATNAEGVSAPSNVVGPLRTDSWRFVDEFTPRVSRQATGRWRYDRHSGGGKLEFVSHEPMSFKMDTSRLRSDTAHLTYDAGGQLGRVQLDLFLMEGGKLPTLFASNAARSWLPLETVRQEFRGLADTPAWPVPVRMSAVPPPGMTRLRVQLASGSELGRLEMSFTPHTQTDSSRQ